MTAKYDKPDSVSADDFGFALHLINSDAVVEIMQYGTYGTSSLSLVCEWDDDKGVFPTDNEMNAAVVKKNLDLVAAAEARVSAIDPVSVI